MKKFLSILLALCLFALCAAGAEPKADVSDLTGRSAKTEAPTETPTEAPTTEPAGDSLGAAVLPSPEEVSAMEAEAAEAAAEPEASDEPEASPEPEAADEPEASAETEVSAEPEPSAEPEASPVPADTFVLWFEEGFNLSLPEGWVSYTVNGADAAQGVRYALGDGMGDRYLYIQLSPTDLKDLDAVSAAVEADAGLARTGALNFGGLDFVSFLDSARNASCCATLWGGDLLVFIFTPQNDPNYMLDASRLMETFTY